MRLGVIIAGLFSAATATGCGKPISEAAQAQFQKAQQAFDSAQSPDDFLRVAGMYQQLVAAGIHSGAVFYNQGNAYMRAGRRGRAIACYRQAQRYRPRDPLLDANLRFAIGSDQVRPPRPLIEYVLFWQDWISYPNKFRLSLLAAAIAAASGLAGLVSRASVWNRAALAVLAITLAVGFSALYDWYRFELVTHGVITSKSVVARKGNAESYEAAFTQPLVEGTEVLVLDRRGDWVQIQLAPGQEGWVPSADVVLF
jgi:hypothetical protein